MLSKNFSLFHACYPQVFLTVVDNFPAKAHFIHRDFSPRLVFRKGRQRILQGRQVRAFFLRDAFKCRPYLRIGTLFRKIAVSTHCVRFAVPRERI